MWSMTQQGQKEIIINDYNSELINAYRVVKSDPENLLMELEKHKYDKSYYYEVRAMDRVAGFCNLPEVIRAARFIYLNRTCFNGLYRVNASGQNKVPFGRYKNPVIANHELTRACSRALASVTIRQGDFEQFNKDIKYGDFFYLDPPYAPLSKTSSFTAYTEKTFDDDMQHRLKNFCDRLTENGARFMMSNSSAPIIYDLYQGYNIAEIQAKRQINASAASRGNVKELIVTNY